MPTSPYLQKLVIIGVGLIGGSFALALRNAGLVKQIVGLGRSQENMLRARELGIIDEIAITPAAALAEADFVMLSTPVGQIQRVMAQIEPYLDKQTIVSDVGSTKQNVIEAAQQQLTNHLAHFIPAHPIAGTEFRGAEAADPLLFKQKHLIITPLKENNEQAINLVKVLWESCGAKVSIMSAEQHDQMLAIVSHLPHMLAFTLMNHIQTCTDFDPNYVLSYAGSSLRDCTRIAASSPEMWRDICLANRVQLLAELDKYQQALTELREQLANRNDEALLSLFKKASDLKLQWSNARDEKD
ncbi:MAG TPA: prephenate dehydrogenase/arogenate dehydrogenase family protein [Nitrosomonas sp.]|nr:prephenate dehydrogenase/arogenate dehydrogenase family protein [Nitrosomonas sp.]